MKRIYLLLATLAILLQACGEGVINVDDIEYQPKISIEGFLIPGQPVDNIKILRNFPVDANLNRLDLTLPTASVVITDLQDNSEHVMTYDADRYTFYDAANGLAVQPQGSYRLDVTATIDGQSLSAHAETTVPSSGLDIVSVNYPSLRYRERDSNDNIRNFKFDFQRSPGTTAYIMTAVATEAGESNFIYDNPFEEVEAEDVVDDLEDWRYESEWIQDLPAEAGVSSIELFWFDFWFYSEYQVVLFAVDKNYIDFYRTYEEVQEIDGNYHPPVFNIEGDGIGVFGSAVADTIMVNVTR